MDDLRTETRLPAWVLASLTLIVAALGFVVIGPLVGFFVAIPFFDGSLDQLMEAIQNPLDHESIKIPFYVIQGSATLIGLTIVPLLFWLGIDQRKISSWFTEGEIHLQMLVVVLVMVIAFMATNSIFIDWNAHLHFPDALKDLELWAREREDLAESVTKFLTQFSNTNQFLIGLLVIAILPAIGEELVFRGMLQPQLHRTFGDIHIAVWISAIVFSAFHLQFFGFVPRMLLGALFGYLYFWSGNLWMSIFAHFVNNGFSVLMLYLRQQKVVEMDVESTAAAPWQAVAVFTILVVALLIYYKRFFDSKAAHGEI
jgi:hypothetical protein